MLIDVFDAVYSKSLGRIVKGERVDVPEDECRNWLYKFALPVETPANELRETEAPADTGNADGDEHAGDAGTDVHAGSESVGRRKPSKRKGTGTSEADSGGRDTHSNDAVSDSSNAEVAD